MSLQKDMQSFPILEGAILAGNLLKHQGAYWFMAYMLMQSCRLQIYLLNGFEI